MGRETIRDNNNRTLGYIDNVAGGKLKATDASFRTLGYYDPRQNKTHDPSYRTIAKGNVLSALIYEQQQNELRRGGSGSATGGGRGATQSGSCSAAIGFIILATFGAIYNWWGEGPNYDQSNAIVDADQQIDLSSSEADSSITSAPNVANSPSSQRSTRVGPKEDEVRGAIMHALDSGAPVQWTVRGQSGWVAVSALTSTRVGACRTVAVTDDQHRPWDKGRVWCRRNGTDWEP